MGLDTVEIVMDVENEFGIQIPDADASRMVTVGDLSDLCLSIIRASGAASLRSRPDLDEYVWGRIQTIVAEFAARPPDQVLRSSRFVEDLRLD